MYTHFLPYIDLLLAISCQTHYPSPASMKKYREEVISCDAETKKKELESGPKASYGYGGKFGVQKDR